MATKVQSKTYFPSSMMDLNNGLCNGMWDLYRNERTSVSERSLRYDPFLMRQQMDGCTGYSKEQMKQTILKQDSIFRHQVQELHRLYKRQTDLMNELTRKEHCNVTMLTEAPTSSHFLSRLLSRKVIDLELPAGVYGDTEGKQPVQNVQNFADLNKQIQVEEASFSASIINNNSSQFFTKNGNFLHQSNLLQVEPKKTPEYLSRKRTLFGIELSESSHSPSFDSSQSSSWDLNTSTPNYNRWIGSSVTTRQIPEAFSSIKRAISNSRFITSSHQNGVIDGKKNHENLEKQLPHWLMATKGKESTLYQMNLDSLQHQSQQFFKKAEKTKDTHGPKVTKILGVPIINVPSNSKDSVQESIKSNQVSELRHHIDLNLTFNEEDDPSSTPSIPEAVVKIATMEIDLEAPAALEPETDDTHEDIIKAAAEAIISISSFEEPQAADTLLMWLAEVIDTGESVDNNSLNINRKDSIPQGMDYFEYMTLNLQEVEEENICYTPMILEEKEEEECLLKKRTTRKGQGKRGRQKKDFQRDVLPGIVSLSRREVTEDLQTFEEAFTGIGISWQSSFSKRKAAGKNGRGRRRLVVPTLCSHTPPPPSPPPPAAVEQTVCREVALEEKSLSGWGKRTRRLPRQRCQNGGSHHSLALKC
nr:hypothetical protein [Tanacetum cinerariifolium]